MNIVLKVFLALSLVISASMANWEMEMVDEPAFFWESSNSVVDKNNNSHVVFGLDHLYHAWFDGTEWKNEIVDPTAKVGGFSSLAIDNNNTLHISYLSSNGTISYATNKDNTWTIEAVETPIRITIPTSIVVDPNNNPHILYKDDLDKSFKLATKTDGVWTIESLQNIDYYSSYVSITSMAVDSLSNIYISYMGGMYTSDRKLMYMSNKTGNWEVTEIGSTTSSSSSIFVDKNDNIHLAYYSSSRDSSNLIVNNITYTTNSSGVWTKELINTEYINNISLKIDTLGYVHISKTLSYGGISYITNKSGEWIKSNVPTHDNYAGRSLSLALDTNGNSYITQIDGVGIKSTTNASGEWVETSVYEPKRISGNVKILIDSKGIEHIVYGYSASYYNRSDNNSIVHATNDPETGWSTTVLNKNLSSIYLNSAVLDEDDALHVSYTAYPSTLIYATNKSGAWAFETVNTDAKTSYFRGEIAVDSLGNVHMTYNNYGEIYYTSNKSGNWVNEQVSQNIRARYNSSITVDKMNNAHISYYDGTNGNLKYATNNSEAWVEETVDVDGWNGYGSSINVSDNGTINISYAFDDYYENNDTYVGGLRLATKSADVWNIESIYNSDLGWPDSTSLTFDSKGFAHISLLEIGSYDLMYATNNQGSWSVERVDWDGYFGRNNSIALGSDDSIHIAYVDGDNSDLKYAYKASETTTIGKYPGYSANGLLCRKNSNGATIIYNEDGEKTIIPANNKEKVKGKKDVVKGKHELLFYNPQTGTCESRENMWKNEFKIAQ